MENLHQGEFSAEIWNLAVLRTSMVPAERLTRQLVIDTARMLECEVMDGDEFQTDEEIAEEEITWEMYDEDGEFLYND